MIFPWTTVDSILSDFENKVEDLNKIAEVADRQMRNALEEAVILKAEATRLAGVKDRALGVANKIRKLIE